MAATGDGSVYIDVQLNVSEADRQLADLRQRMEGLEQSGTGPSPQMVQDADALVSAINTAVASVNALTESFAGTARVSASLGQQTAQTSISTEALSNDFTRMQSAIRAGFGSQDKVLAFADLIGQARMHVEQLQTQLRALGEQRIPTDGFAQLSAQAQQAQARLDVLIDRQSRMDALGVSHSSRQWQALTAEIDAAQRSVQSYNESRQAMEQAGTAYTMGTDTAQYQELNALLQQAEAQIQRNSSLINYEAIAQAQLNLQAAQEAYAVAQTESERTSALARIQEAQAQLAGLTANVAQTSEAANEAAGGMDAMAAATERVGAAAGTAGSMMSSFAHRVGGLIKRVFVFSVITTALRSVREYMSKVIAANDETRAAIARLKAAFQTLAQPILQVVIPALTTLINVLSRVVTAIAGFLSRLTGSTLKKSADAAKSFHEEQKAVTGVGKAADKATSQLAAFDEINQLQEEDAGAGADALAGGGDIGDIEPDFTGMIEDQLTAINELFTGFLLLALGAILAFSGVNIPLGITLMAIGAAFIWSAVALRWDELKKELNEKTAGALVITGMVLLVIGAVLAFTGVKLLLGVTLMAIGAAMIWVALAGNPNAVAQFLQQPLTIVLGVLLGVGLLVIGAVLAFSGTNVPLGITLMALGAITIFAIVVANWSAIMELLRDPLIGPLVLFAGAALLIVGAVLAFSGTNVPLGITLMALGGIAVFAVIVANWDTIMEVLRDPIVAPIVLFVGAVLLIIGTVLAFSGTSLPLGITLMALGAAAIFAVIVANWDTIAQVLQEPFAAVTAVITSIGLLAIGAVLAFSGAHLLLGIGLMVTGALLLFAAIVANWDTIAQALQGPLGDVVVMVSSALLAIGAVLAFSGAALPLGLGMMAVGAVGLAMQVIANWDNITKSIGNVVNEIFLVVSPALLVLGVILLFTGAATALGLGLIAAGAVGLALAIVPKWDFLKEAISKAYNNMKDWWDNHAKKFFTLDYWKGIGKDMMDGLFGSLNSMKEKITSWGGGFIDKVKGVFRIGSPSKVFADMGQYMVAGLSNGISSDSGQAIQALQKLLNACLTAVKTVTQQMRESFQTFMQYLVGTFLQQWQATWQAMLSSSQNAMANVNTSLDQLNKNLADLQKDVTVNVKTVRTERTNATSRISAPVVRAVDIPQLARGAVIPPNQSFLAVLGDQRSGNNLEMPEDTMRAIVREEMGNTESLLRAILDAVREGQVLKVDDTVLGKVTARSINKLVQRTGKPVILQ